MVKMIFKVSRYWRYLLTADRKMATEQLSSLQCIIIERDDIRYDRRV